MKGIILIGHGDWGLGLLSSAKVLFGDTLKDVEALSLGIEDDPGEFEEKLKSLIDTYSQKDGAYILADLTGGTPGNIATRNIKENIDVITGANLALFVEVLTSRLSDEVDINNMIESSKNNMVYINDFLKRNL